MNSSPFVKIVASNLCSVGDIAIPDSDTIRVVSILGKARMGKSTFLNAIVSQLTGKNAAPFATQDNDEHCTRGIDAYYCKANSLLLLDCQGLALEDSSHDPALLLFAYLISDTIIFNERMMLQNEALKLLEPICTFMTYIDIEEIKKPKLYFRISDGDMVKDPRKNLEKVMTHYKDQYQSIRDSVTHLFQPGIGIVKTDALDRMTKAHIQTGNYAALFTATDELGFAVAIRDILSGLPTGQPAAVWKHSIPRIIQNINRNEKITIDKLDIVGQTGRIEILEALQALSPEVFTEIPVDSTQATYDKNVEPRKAQKKKILSDFTRRFKSVSSAIKDSHYTTLSERLAAPIEEATKRSIVCAEKVVAEAVSAARNATFAPITTERASFTRTTEAFFDTYLDVFRRLQNICKNVYQPVREKYESWVKTQEEALMTLVEAVRKEEAQEVQAMTAMCNDVAERFEANTVEKIAAMTDYTVRGKSQSILGVEPKELIQAILQELTQYVATKFTRKVQKITFVPGTTGTGTGGTASVAGGDSSESSGTGGVVVVAGGTATSTGTGGSVSIVGYGYSSSTPAKGGSVVLRSGTGSTYGGDLIMIAGPNGQWHKTECRDYTIKVPILAFDLLQPIYNTFVDRMMRFADSSALLNAVRTRKNTLLHGYSLDCDIDMPGVDFIVVYDKGKKNKMTVGTYQTIFKKHVDNTLCRMVEKGYITKEDESELIVEQEDNIVRVGDHSCGSVSELFWHTYAKIIARARVVGEPIVYKYEGVGEVSSAPLKKESVFTKPNAISDALCIFLGVPKSTLLSRSEVTTRVCRYAKERSLMVKQVIHADAPLRKLLALTESDELTILNLQRYLKPHYI